MHICASLGLLKDGQAKLLKDSGVDRYNHNLETSKRHFLNVVNSHTWESRYSTLLKARDAGLELCTGSLTGMGESKLDWVHMAYELKELNPESIPINFLNPRPGTPFSEIAKLTPEDALKILCIYRYVHPKADIRIAGGREEILVDQQSEGLRIANSIFIDGYLTTPGQGKSKDLTMIEEAGFNIIIT